MASLEERAREFRTAAHKRDFLPSPYWSDEDATAFARQIAREERERCMKAICVDCRNGLPYTGEGRHSEEEAFMGYECRAAAIRRLEDV